MSSTSEEKRAVWKYAAIPALILAMLAIYPQLNLWVARGSDWNGSYVVSNYDEVAYSAYTNALIEGKPRKYDPFLAREVEHESLYSIQFIPAYAIALPARFLGLSASTVFIILHLLIAIFSSLAVFALIRSVANDEMLAAVGTVVVLCLGTAVAFQGELRHLIDGRVTLDFLPFLRRYQPGFAFPLFFVFCWMVWRSLTDKAARKRIVFAVGSGALFAILVFSYFFLWTAAAAWLVCLAALWIILRRENLARIVLLIVTVGVFAVAALVPYISMVAARSENADAVNVMSFTRSPVLASTVMIFGVLIAAVAVVLARKGRLDGRSSGFAFGLSLALVPVVMLNQQVLTGRSLQPIHYEIFIGNYLVLAAAVLLFGGLIAAGSESRRVLLYVGLIAAGWGIFEATMPASREAQIATIRDETVPAARYIEEQSSGGPAPVVHATNFVSADFIPTVAAVRPLWNAHTSSAGGVTPEENQRLFYLYLYYSGFGEKDLGEALTANSFEVTAAIFGSERALPSLGSPTAAITGQEIQAEARKYAAFAQNFTAETAANPALTHIIVPTEAEPDLRSLDRWYHRDAGKEFGLFKVYKLTLR